MIMSTGILRCIEIFSEPSYYAYSDLIQFFYKVNSFGVHTWPESDFFPCFACYTNDSEDPALHR